MLGQYGLTCRPNDSSRIANYHAISLASMCGRTVICLHEMPTSTSPCIIKGASLTYSHGHKAYRNSAVVLELPISI